MDKNLEGERTLTVIDNDKRKEAYYDGFEKVAKKHHWRIEWLDAINSDKIARLDFRGIPLNHVIFRDLPKNNFSEAERVLEWLKKNNKISINADNTVGGKSIFADKHFQQGLFLLDPILKEYALPTYEAKFKENVLSYVESKRVSFPIVLKPRRGSLGEGIKLIKNKKELDEIKDFSGLLIEQYIEPECDWRVFVVGGTPVGVMRKTGNPDRPDDFELWSGGYHRSLEKNPDIIEVVGKIACRAAAISHLEYTGVDIIRGKNTNKYYILEANFNAGWFNIPPSIGFSVPELMFNWIKDRSDAKNQSTAESIKRYIKNRKQYLSRKTRENYEKILAGEKGITKKLAEQFKPYPSKYLYDAGLIFKKLADAYENDLPAENLIKEIEQMPLSWAGNFIGPEVGVLEDGAILSALYLYLLGKTKKV